MTLTVRPGVVASLAEEMEMGFRDNRLSHFIVRGSVIGV